MKNLDLTNITIKADYLKYKRQPAFTQFYKIDTSKIYPLNGRGEDGYRLFFIDGRPSGSYILKVTVENMLKDNKPYIDDYGTTIKLIKQTIKNEGCDCNA